VYVVASSVPVSTQLPQWISFNKQFVMVHNVALVVKVSSVQVNSLVWLTLLPRPASPGWERLGMGRCVIFGTSRPFAPTAPYIHCNPSRPCSLTSLWAGKWSMTIEGRVSLCRAESSAVYFRVYFHVVTEIIQLKSRRNIYKMTVTSVADVWPVCRGCWRLTLTALWRWSMI